MRKWLWLFLLVSASAFGDIAKRLDWLLNNPLAGLPKFETASPPTLATAKLGRLLFYDKRLSVDGTVSCATCHQVTAGFSNTLDVSIGVGGQKGTRKAPVILNKAFLSPQFWDGRVTTLEEQAVGPLFNAKEMGTTPEKLIATVTAIKGYAPHFTAAFGDDRIDVDRIARAISDFERTLLSGNSKFDRGELDEEAQKGFELFEDRDCRQCHVPPFFTDDKFHNTGHGFKNGGFVDTGRFAISQRPEDTGAFKTPTLRNLSKHAPYMHDGSLKTLEDVIEFYNKGGIGNPHLSDHMIPLGLRPQEKKALLAFLMSLEGEGFEETAPTPEEMPL